jgi:homogentisate phytyltransferase / homogentisate geranylgeranyltransferase
VRAVTALHTFWKFTRPHTVIGSALSVSAIYVLVLGATGASPSHLGLWLPSLVAALACNVFITGLNQWCDVEVDRINKPWLPIPAGELSRRDALRIVLMSLLLALGTAATLSWMFLGLIALISFLGWAYSMPPIQLKRHHFGAALAITVVRGLLVNLGFYAHYRQQLVGEARLDAIIWPLTLFVALFSIGIAWFKDIPDTTGDAEYRFGTLAVRMGRRAAFWAGIAVVAAGYVAIVIAAAVRMLPARGFYLAAFGLPLVLFLVRAARLDVRDDVAVKRFYLFFWGLFFLAYVLYPIGALVGVR